MSSEHVEVLERLRGVLEHGKMGDKCLIAPDLVTAAIAALSAPQPPAEAHPVGVVRRDTGVTITLDRLPYYKGVRLASGTKLYAHPPPSAPVGVEAGWYRYNKPAPRWEDTKFGKWLDPAVYGPPREQHGYSLEVAPLAQQPAPVATAGVEGLNAAAVEAGHTTFESMKQCADAWLAVVDALNTAAPGWNEKKGTGRECATAAIAALAQQPAVCAHSWHDYGTVPRAWCSRCNAVAVAGHEDRPYGVLSVSDDGKYRTDPIQQPAAVDEVRIPRKLADRVMTALGKFTSDEGWSAVDMETADDFGALAGQQGGEK